MAVSEQGVADKMVFRRTNEHPGRHIFITPDHSSMRHLAYGRIVLNSARTIESFSTGDRETGLICLSGRAVVIVDQKEIEIGQYDAVYVPRDSAVSITTNTSVDIAEVSSDVANRYPLQVTRAAEIAKDPKLDYNTGAPGCTRHIRMSLGKNIEAGRLIAGITQAEPGNWTSWPPHEHAEMLEEIYIYFDMPAPAYGIQLVYTDQQEPELVTVVRDGDAVLIPKGYHPNVAVPGHRICFLWAMAAHREVVDRQYGVVNLESGFNA
jgi:5-deoxy-glucuronate isomerase